MSEPATIAQILGRVMVDVEEVGKGGRHEKQGYTYRKVDDIVNAAGAALRKHGVVPVPVLRTISYEQTEVGKNRTPTRIAQVQVEYQFHGPAGDHISAVVPAESMDSGDKSTPKAMSVAYRIALSQVLAIPTGDPDPAETDFRRSEPWTAHELAKTAISNRKSRTRLLSTYGVARKSELLDHIVINEDKAEEPLGDMIKRLGEVTAKAAPKKTAQRKPILEPDLSTKDMPEPETEVTGDE